METGELAKATRSRKPAAGPDVGGREIVAVGASAGGVASLQYLVAGLPRDFPGAVLVSLHVSRSHPSHLSRILGRAAHLPASPAVDGQAIEPGHIYVAPADSHLLVARGHLRLWRGPLEDGFRPAINPMFRTAAKAYGSSVVGVLLSGGLHDGTAGLMAIKTRGGIVILQDPNETLYPQMPLNAMKHVNVDYVLSLVEIPPLLRVLLRPRTSRHQNGRAAQPPPAPEAPAQEVPAPGPPAPGNAAHEQATVESLASGTATPFVCPECGGALWETFEGGLIHFHCHVGHIYSVEGLAAGQADVVERGLWTALRSLEERAALLLRMARQMQGAENDAARGRLEAQARALEERAALVRRTIEKVLAPESEAEQSQPGPMNIGERDEHSE